MIRLAVVSDGVDVILPGGDGSVPVGRHGSRRCVPELQVNRLTSGEPVDSRRGNAAIRRTDILAECEMSVVGGDPGELVGISPLEPHLRGKRVGFDVDTTAARQLLFVQRLAGDIQKCVSVAVQ